MQSETGNNPFRKIFRYLFRGRRFFQPLFERLNWLSFYGLNIGGGSLLEDSGELYVIDFFSKQVSANDKAVIFDVGAHFGEYATALIENLKEADIYCFEPGKKTFQSLSENLENYNNVKLFNYGFGEREEEVTLFADSETSGSASVYENCFDHIGLPSKPIDTIHLKSLDKFCKENMIEHINFLKLDVEGHEYRVLLGAKELIESDSIDFIQFEFGPCNIVSRTFLKDFFGLLGDRYDIYRILRDGLSWIKIYHSRNEAFITTNYLAISKRLNINSGNN